MITVTIVTYQDRAYQSEWQFKIERRTNNTFLLYTIYKNPVQKDMYDDHFSHMDDMGRFVYIFYSIVDNNGIYVDDAMMNDDAQVIPDRPPLIVRQVDTRRILMGIAEIQRMELIV